MFSAAQGRAGNNRKTIVAKQVIPKESAKKGVVCLIIILC
jgi:hypothetical protein